MGSVTFQFAGVCTHFRFGVAAGVPHRVVLPDASRFLTGFLAVSSPAADDPVLYYIKPHFAQFDLTSDAAPVLGDPVNNLSTRLTAPGLIENGGIHFGIRMQLANAVDTQMSYDGRIPTLTTWVPDYSFSSDVVLSGRAACYVDIYGGVQTTIENTSGGPDTVLIKVQTQGPPLLLVSSLLPSSVTRTPGSSAVIPLSSEDEDLTLIVQNVEAVQEDPAGDTQYDYLLHYLTARGGIPQIIQPAPGSGQLLPGMVPPLVPASAEAIGSSLIQLGKVLDPAAAAATPLGRRHLVGNYDTTPACSDSQYP